jgi:hypothetical protein
MPVETTYTGQSNRTGFHNDDGVAQAVIASLNDLSESLGFDGYDLEQLRGAVITIAVCTAMGRMGSTTATAEVIITR